MINLFRQQTFPFWKPGKNGYAVLSHEGQYPDGMLKMVLKFYHADDRFYAAFFTGSGAPWAQVIDHPSKDYAGSGRPIPEGWYFMDAPIRMKYREPGVGFVKIPCDQTRFAQNNRSALLIHVDDNASTYPGTVGCVYPRVAGEMEAICRAQAATNCTLLIVDYNLGVVDQPVSKASQKDRKCFEWIYQFTKEWEGGYVNDPSDLGGSTNYGITQVVADQFGLGSVKNLTPEKAKDFYFDQYYVQWAKSWYLNGAMFDTAVNFGLIGANMFLQEALGFSGADVDGKVGAITRGRLEKANPDLVAQSIVKGRIQYRYQRVKESPSQEKFLQGWLNRDQALLKKITK